MIVERKDNEIIVRFSVGTKASEIQSLLDYQETKILDEDVHWEVGLSLSNFCRSGR